MSIMGDFTYELQGFSEKTRPGRKFYYRGEVQKRAGEMVRKNFVSYIKPI